MRVSLDPQRSFKWFGGWECRATLYVPRDVRAHLQTNAGSVSIRDLEGCELGVKVNAGKIDLVKVYGLVHLSADAGSVTGRDVGGYFDVETQAGSVRLEIMDLQPGEHRVRATTGSVRLELARGLDVCIEAHTSLGSFATAIPSRPSAATKLVLSTEMGSVRVDEGSLFALAIGDRRRRSAAPSASAPARRARIRARAHPEDGRGWRAVGPGRRRAVASDGARLSHARSPERGHGRRRSPAHPRAPRTTKDHRRRGRRAAGRAG